MRNNGSLVWPQGTQLVWIGGDKLSDIVSVQIEVGDDVMLASVVQLCLPIFLFALVVF